MDLFDNINNNSIQEEMKDANWFSIVIFIKTGIWIIKKSHL